MPRTDALCVFDYYVSLKRGVRTAFIAGPFATHTEALAMVNKAVALANELDPWSHFDAYGTCSLPHAVGNPIGLLNERLGITKP
jgi:hypothetical protein